MIRKLKKTRKIKHFLWQALSDCLATCSRLVDRHCGTERLFRRCGTEEETINHCLFLCPPALQTWALSDISSSPGSFPSKSLVENFVYLLLRAKNLGTPTNVLARFPWIISLECLTISSMPSGCILGEKFKCLWRWFRF
ncbi:hypothetical protein Bca52824_072242 [Brassica carinata]|uniref:Reverse transcriptase zinc-binding domain-containing protein n=1 Tax=Brassica carinata TaxID=52824 RepID=A0A8X7Q8F4_BRACI|nr:hypothetical protein Bca52824_072242 [Brassica carinata]